MRLPFQLNHINLWLLEDGDGWTVVDTGIRDEATAEAWKQLFAGTMRDKPVKRVIVTHLHPDHVGLAGWLVRRFDTMLWMSRTDYLMCRNLAADTGQEAPQEGIRFYQAAGFPEDALEDYQHPLRRLRQRRLPAAKCLSPHRRRRGDRNRRAHMAGRRRPRPCARTCLPVVQGTEPDHLRRSDPAAHLIEHFSCFRPSRMPIRCANGWILRGAEGVAAGRHSGPAIAQRAVPRREGAPAGTDRRSRSQSGKAGGALQPSPSAPSTASRRCSAAASPPAISAWRPAKAWPISIACAIAERYAARRMKTASTGIRPPGARASRRSSSQAGWRRHGRHRRWCARRRPALPPARYSARD